MSVSVPRCGHPQNWCVLFFWRKASVPQVTTSNCMSKVCPIKEVIINERTGLPAPRYDCVNNWRLGIFSGYPAMYVWQKVPFPPSLSPPPYNPRALVFAVSILIRDATNSIFFGQSVQCLSAF